MWFVKKILYVEVLIMCCPSLIFNLNFFFFFGATSFDSKGCLYVNLLTLEKKKKKKKKKRLTYIYIYIYTRKYWWDSSGYCMDSCCFTRWCVQSDRSPNSILDRWISAPWPIWSLITCYQMQVTKTNFIFIFFVVA